MFSPATTIKAILSLMVLTLPLNLGGCKYSEPRWHLTSQEVVINKDARRFVIAVASTLAREPQGFISQFPDGGSWDVIREKISVWSFDSETLAFERIAEIKRPADIASGLSFHCEGWNDSGDFDISVRGNTGSTSDTPVVRHYFRIKALTEPKEVSALPDTRRSIQTGSLADQRLLVDLDRRPPQDFIGVGLSKSHSLPYRRVFNIQLDGSVQRAAPASRQ